MPHEQTGSVRPARTPIAVFASGAGTNLQSILDIEQQDPAWPALTALVVSDKPQCEAVRRAKSAHVSVFARDPKDYADKSAYERAVLAELQKRDVEWIVLAGYMRIVSPVLLNAYRGRILNIHPSLLPKFPGRHAVRDALQAGAVQTGVTVHLVDEGVDTGPILAQRAVAVQPGITEEALLERLHEVEHELYPKVIREVLISGSPHSETIVRSGKHE
ncbi:phosphoribosylglycinamide formyltransferase [Alicyclobacillus tolerans]|uniref:phosphoribosylglycinamide formyltransferase n=1 Tax=Alicyclobacillus tolerans TaxID=90970 RepID=UPI001F023ADF|nr:phosphoribosylglycinamide formyltransferase [Alicyclobacillus tolerans]MCF8566322.1 phosphoribosylglycinamide formyltransferase [Alicyclobacillus tolerans]